MKIQTKSHHKTRIDVKKYKDKMIQLQSRIQSKKGQLFGYCGKQMAKLMSSPITPEKKSQSGIYIYFFFFLKTETNYVSGVGQKRDRDDETESTETEKPRKRRKKTAIVQYLTPTTKAPKQKECVDIINSLNHKITNLVQLKSTPYVDIKQIDEDIKRLNNDKKAISLELQ